MLKILQIIYIDKYKLNNNYIHLKITKLYYDYYNAFKRITDNTNKINSDYL